MNSQGAVLAVIEAIGYANGRPPEELGYSLHEYIDLDVLAMLADGMNTTWELSFELPEHDVRVTNDGLIFVDEVRFEVDDPVVSRDKTWIEDTSDRSNIGLEDKEFIYTKGD